MAGSWALKTTASVINAGLFSDKNPLYMPRAFGRVAPFVRENVQVQPTSGSIALGTTQCTFNLNKQGDYVARISLRGTLKALTAAAAPGTFARYCDMVVQNLVTQVRILYNSQKLQYINPLELQLYPEYYMDDEESANVNTNLLTSLSDAQRAQDAKNTQDFKLTFYTMFLCQTMEQAAFIGGLSQPLQVQIDFNSANNLVQTDDPAYPALVDSSFLTNTYLQVRGLV